MYTTMQKYLDILKTIESLHKSIPFETEWRHEMIQELNQIDNVYNIVENMPYNEFKEKVYMFIKGHIGDEKCELFIQKI